MQKSKGKWSELCSFFVQMLNLINGNHIFCLGEKLQERCTSLLLQFRGNGLWCSWTSFVWVSRWVRGTFFRCRRVISQGGYALLHRLTVRQAVMDHTCCFWPACRAETSLFPTFFPHHQTLLLHALLQETKTEFWGRTSAAALMDRFIWRDEVVSCIFSRHICPVLLGGISAKFSWDADMQVFFPPPQTDMSS